MGCLPAARELGGGGTAAVPCVGLAGMWSPVVTEDFGGLATGAGTGVGGVGADAGGGTNAGATVTGAEGSAEEMILLPFFFFFLFFLLLVSVVRLKCVLVLLLSGG